MIMHFAFQKTMLSGFSLAARQSTAFRYLALAAVNAL